MRNRSLWSKLLSALLVMVMVLGMVPAGMVSVAEASEITEAGAIKIDFIDFARTLKEDRPDIWNALRSTSVDGIKMIGNGYSESSTDAEYNAFQAIQSYLDAEGVWNIEEGDHTFKQKSAGRKIYLNTTDDDYGLRFYAGILASSGDDRSRLILTVNAPEAGLYHMNLSVLNEAVTSTVSGVDNTAGRGAGDVYVNGELVYEHYAFKAYTDTVEEVSFGAVQLNRGENTVEIYMDDDHFGAGGASSSGRRCCNLRGLDFIPLNGVQVELGRTVELDLRATYLPFDTTITGSTYTVQSDDESIAKAAFEADGDLLITGYDLGDAELTVYDGSGEICTIPVTTVEPTAPENGTYYTVGGFKAATMVYETVEEGSVSYYADGTRYDEETIRTTGAVYFKSNDTGVATVDQSTGDVTCVGEGSTTIVAYVLMDGMITSDYVILTVTDETDLASIELSANVDYVGVGGSLRIYPSGLKASGSTADMDLYPLSWTVDDMDVASVSDDGVVTGLSEGTVTVTATAGVDGVAVSNEITLNVVDNQELEENDLIFDFTYGRALDMQSATLEKDNIEIDWTNTYNGGMDIYYGDTSGIDLYVGQKGDKLALDFVVERDGWYQVEVLGKSIYYAGVYTNIFVDESYIGDIAFNNTSMSTYSEGGPRNTVYLEAGVHDFDLVATSYGRMWLGKIILHSVPAPAPVSVELTGKQTLVAGETVELDLTMTDSNGNSFYLNRVSEAASYDNYYTLTSSNENAVTLDGLTMTAAGSGTSTITLSGKLLGETITKTLQVTVQSGTINYAELTADSTTLKPDAAPVQLTLTAYGATGEAIALPSGTTVSYASGDTGIATVSSSGLVTLTGLEGSVMITATITEGTNVREAQIWISVTEGKTEPTIYTYEERENAQANVAKYTWAANEKNTAVRNADIYVEHLQQIYDQWLFDDLPRTTRVGYKNELGYDCCRYCGVNLVAIYGAYPYIVDPINNPWKITCPECQHDFPSNDFASFLACGMDENGRFDADRARENGGEQYLVNIEFDDMPADWGVDDGNGYVTGEYDANGVEVVHTYIGYYMACQMFGLGDLDKHSLTDIFQNLTKAYLYTGDEKYGSAGAVLVDRLADIYPTYDIVKWPHTKLAFSDGGSGRGKFIGCIWDAVLSQTLAKAVDAFWPCATNADVIEFLQQDDILTIKGMTADQITPEYLRTHAEDDILLEIFKAAKTDYFNGNFGMEEAGVAYAGVALDRLPETQEMFEWVFHEEQRGGLGSNAWNTGGDVARVLIEDVCRDGFGYEVSYLYNALWTQYLLDLADALSGYEGAAEFDLWNNPKFVNMYSAFIRLTVCGHLTPQVGEAGFVQSTHNQMGVDKMLTAYLNTGDVDLARAVYAGNGNSVSGLHGTIFMADPVDGVQSSIINAVAQEGPWDFSDSDMMSGFGIAILREGPEQYLGKTVNADEFFDYWMYFGYSNTSHARLEALAIDLEAFGLGLSSSMGYPSLVISTSPERMQWVRNTVSHNTVVVDDRGQSVMEEGGFPKHFEDAGNVKIMDVEANAAYPETDIYRRTVVTVAAENGVHYAVDFFRILGGSEHVYSFHGATRKDPAVSGLDMTVQPMGTYAGADVPFGDHVTNPDSGDASTNTGSGYSWLYNVSRDDNPETSFSIDWEIEDFHSQLTTSDGIHLKLHMLSEEPMTEVALADGQPPQTGRNPDHIEYALIRRSGNPGMDTLFTAIIEPYQNDELIASTELVDVELVSGTPSLNDRAAAIKVTLVGGRQDFIVYTTNPDCVYSVKNTDGTEMFRFQGFAGVCSYNKSNVITYAWGAETSNITDATAGAVISDAQTKVTGQVSDFTKGLAFDYLVTVSMDEPVEAEELVGRYLYVNNDGTENAAYRIHDAEVNGSTAVLNLNNQTLVREFVDASNMDLGYVHNIAEGQTYTIPLSTEMVCAHQRNSVSYASNGDGTHTLTRTCVTCKAITSTSVVACKDGTDANTLCDRCNGQLPVEIATAEQLMAFAADVNAGSNTINAKLTANIDLSGYDWTPIGTVTYPYKGIFTGDGHTIYGMDLAYTTVSGEDVRLGLFANTLGATIKGVTVDGSITLSGASTNYSRVGGLIAVATNTTITDCINKVTITGTANGNTAAFFNVGGLVGYASAVTMTRCGNDANIDIMANNMGGLIGNVARATEPTAISECYNHGDIFGYANLGGLVGNFNGCGTTGKNNTLTNSYSSGDFETHLADGTGRAAGGGLIGSANAALCVVKNCYVSGATPLDGENTDMAIIYSGYSYNITNNWMDLYYLEGVSTDETYDIMMAKTHEEMIDQEFVDTLGSSFKKVENKYPVLSWECSHLESEEIYYDNGDGTHLVVFTCGECGAEDRTVEPCTDIDQNEICDGCKASLSLVDEITFAGSNMNLGNELQMNFLFAKKQLDASKNYTAVITKYDENGEVENTVEVAKAQWNSFGTDYYKVSYGVLSIEMPEQIRVQIVDEDGTALGEFTDSIRGYAERVLASATTSDAIKRLAVDMLNYGAAAQTYFEHNLEDLANSKLTDEQKALASEGFAPCVNNQKKIKNFYGCNLNLAERIELSFFFRNRPSDVTGMYGTISFTDFTGKEVSVALTEADLELANSTNVQNLCRVRVDQIVLADARQVVSVEIYNADGTLFGSAKDSVESYIKRGENSAHVYLFESVMTFADSAYDYLLNR